MTDVETGKGKIKTLNEQLKLNITEKEKINKKIKDQATEYDKKIEKLNAELKAAKGKKGKDNSGSKALEKEVADLKVKVADLESNLKSIT